MMKTHEVVDPDDIGTEGEVEQDPRSGRANSCNEAIFESVELEIKPLVFRQVARN